MLYRKLIVVPLATLIAFALFAQNGSAQSVEGEVFVGAEVSNEKNDTSSTSRGSFALGGGLLVGLTGTASVDLKLHAFPMFCFGSSKEGALDITQFHLPLGLLLQFGEKDGTPETVTIGGGVGGGYMFTAGMLATKDTDLRPYLEVEVMLRLFKRGLFKLRYNTVFGPYTDALGSSVTYHTICIIGSTSW